MYAAFNQNKKLVNAIESNFEDQYFCANCNRPVKLIRNDNNSFFRHENACNNEENERSIHKKGKKLIVDALKIIGYKDITLEHYLKTIKQRPDIMIDQRIVIEYQCAKINIDKLMNRVESYHALGITNIWILGGEYLSNKLYRVHMKFISYNLNWGFYLLMLDSEHDQISLFYGIRFFGPFNKVQYKRKIFLIEDILELLEFKPKLSPVEGIEIDHYQLRKIRKLTGKGINRFKADYYNQNNETVENFLKGKRFGVMKPIYQNHQWRISCGECEQYLKQPFLCTKKEDN
ncbi:hypothetical protein M5C72_03855 [Companilactobacillus allii]|uniref:Competence protein CoiA nuclease-like domain-containing protein n=1 Tax=Companilactobacillus allii TaxID=1847728 RepID=A0A1P8Q340_9LACO|nr:competence protein CoiA family protein [Companilactobacillus allii]APX72284.1 hypothetical protein BTM29_06795 [Companilactobacillus allii]USQ69375.1 hypothetical protein M5C72_03855 [Companilactobacillus allii]